MANAIQELKLILSLDTKAYQAGLKGAKTSLLGLSSAQVAFGVAAAQYAMRGIDALVRKYLEYDQVLDKLSYTAINTARAEDVLFSAHLATTASLGKVAEAVSVYSARLEESRGRIAELTSVTAQYAEDTGDSAGSIATSISALANRWGKDAGGIASAMMQAGQISGLAMSAIGEQVVQATPLMKALGYSFETTLAKAALFNKHGYDFSKYVTLMQKNFEKFGGNVKAANREITTIENTVRGFKSQGEAVGYLMEKGFSSTAAIELAEMLRLNLNKELDETITKLSEVGQGVASASKMVESNLAWWERLGLAIKSIFTPAFSPSESKDILKSRGYSDKEIEKIIDNIDDFQRLLQDDKLFPSLQPGKILNFDFNKYKVPGPTGWNPITPIKSPTPLFTSAAGFGSDYGGSAASMMINDMDRLGDTGEAVANSIQGNLSRAFYEVSQFADNSSGAMRVSLVTAIDGASEGMGALADSAEKATEGVQGLNDTSQGTKSTWEQIESWLTKAADKLGIDSELLVNNIWTGLARVGKESLEKLGIDVDGLQSKMADFFGKAKGYGFDINAFWKWAQEGTGQTTKQIWDQTLDQMAKATGNFIMQASAMFATGTVDWRELFSGLWRSILASTVTAVAKMVADWIAGLEIIAQAKAWLETMPGVAAAIAIGAIAVGGIALLASSKQQPAMASGGVVMGPTRALIGEAGPEAVFPLEKLNDLGIPFGRGGRGASTSVVNITVNNPILNNRTTESDVRAFMERISRELVRKGVVANSYA